MDQETTNDPTDIAEIHAKARSGFLWILGSNAIWQITSWILTLATARVLLPKDYGILAVAETFFPYLTLVTTLRLGSWLVQREKLDPEDEATVFTLLIFLGVASSATTFLAAPLIAALYRSPAATEPLQYLAVIFLCIPFYITANSRLQRRLNFKPQAIVDSTIGISRSVLTLVLAICGFSFWSLVIGMIFKEIAAAVCYSKLAGIPARLHWNTKVADQAVRYGVAAALSAVLWIVFSTADNIVVGRLFGVEMLGFYSMAFFLAELPLSKINTVISPIIVPYLSRLKFHPHVMRERFVRINKGIFSIVAPALIGLCVTADEFVPLLLGEKWLPLITPFQVLSFVGLLRSVTANGAALLFSLGKPKLYAYYTGLCAITLPPAFYFFGREFGLAGIYGTWLILYPLIGLTSYIILLQRSADIDPAKYLRSFVAPGTCSAIMALGCLGVGALLKDSSHLVVLSIKMAAGMVLYPASFFFLFRREALESIAMLRSMFLKRA